MDAKPIDFVYDFESDSYDLDKFKTDQELIEQIKRGRTQQSIYRNHDKVIKVKDLFGGITPEGLYQNLQTGQNNIESASAALFTIYT